MATFIPSPSSLHSWPTYALFPGTILLGAKVVLTPWKPARPTLSSPPSLPQLHGVKPPPSQSPDADRAIPLP